MGVTLELRCNECCRTMRYNVLMDALVGGWKVESNEDGSIDKCTCRMCNNVTMQEAALYETEEGCRKIIKECGYNPMAVDADENNTRRAWPLSLNARKVTEFFGKLNGGWPTLKDWQAAAKWASVRKLKGEEE